MVPYSRTTESFESPVPSTHWKRVWRPSATAPGSSAFNGTERALAFIRRTHERRTVMGKLEGKIAVITAATSGMALATAKLFVEEGAYVFITGRRKDKLDEAVKLIGKNVTGVQGDASNLADLDRLYDTVKREKGKIDILFASAGQGELAKLEEVTEEHFDK